METELLLSYALFILLHLWIIGLTYRFRKRIPCMTGMMIAMAIGMTSGLGFGTLAGMLFQELFFQVTVAGMLIGGITGALTGLAISLMSVLDGFLSGIMSGMMGAMLGVMIPESHVDSMYKILSIIIAAVIFILFLIIQSELKIEISGVYQLFASPGALFSLILIYLFQVHQSEIIPIENQHPITHQHKEDQNQNQLQPDQTLYVEAKDFQFTPSTLNIRKNEQISIVLKNNGKVEHDFEITNTNIHIHALPNQVNQTTVKIQKPGTYQAVCTLPGHKEKGMVAVVKVM